jgi:hypothetical protein
MRLNKGIANILIIIVIAVGIGGVWYFLSKKSSNLSHPISPTQLPAPSETAVVNTGNEKAEVRDLIANFEDKLEQRDINGIMAFFTPPETKDEKDLYNSIMGLDAQGIKPRLFNNVSSNFYTLSYGITEQNGIERLTREGNKYIAVVKEMRKIYGGPANPQWLGPSEFSFVFEIVKKDGSWMIDKYYDEGLSIDYQPPTMKYRGLGF